MNVHKAGQDKSVSVYESCERRPDFFLYQAVAASNFSSFLSL